MTTRRPSPTTLAAENALDRLDQLRRKPDTPGLQSPLIDLARRIRALLPRLDAGRPIPDGYPAATTGASHGTSELTSVEAAANARTFGRRIHDPIHEHGHRAVTRFIHAIDELDAAIRDLDVIDRIGNDDPVDDTHCESCARTLPRPRDARTRGTVGGRLDKVMRLCDPCRWFIEDHDRLPTEHELDTHDRTGRWRIRRTG